VIGYSSNLCWFQLGSLDEGGEAYSADKAAVETWGLQRLQENTGCNR
jgi:hypothetical protein